MPRQVPFSLSSSPSNVVTFQEAPSNYGQCAACDGPTISCRGGEEAAEESRESAAACLDSRGQLGYPGGRHPAGQPPDGAMRIHQSVQLCMAFCRCLCKWGDTAVANCTGARWSQLAATMAPELQPPQVAQQRQGCAGPSARSQCCSVERRHLHMLCWYAGWEQFRQAGRTGRDTWHHKAWGHMDTDTDRR